MVKTAETVWTDDQREALINMLQAGLSYRQIGIALHKTRSAVGGKILRDVEIQNATPGRFHRGQPSLPTHAKGGRKPAKPRVGPTGPRVGPVRANGAPKPPAGPPGPLTPPPPATPPAQPPAGAGPRSFRVTLTDLKSSECKWPGSWEPKVMGGYLFCGHAVEAPGAPYCRYHSQLANPSGLNRPAYDEPSAKAGRR